MRPTLRAVLTAGLWAVALPLLAQSPNTSSLVVIVEDQQGAVVPEATVSLTNPTTGVSREAVSGAGGAATLTALPLTGLYQVTVSKAGFADATAGDVALRAGETATIRVKLPVAGGKSEVTVYGTTEGVRNDPAAGHPPRQPDDRRDPDPRPQVHHPAPPQLGLPAGQGHGRPVRQRDLLHHRRGLAARHLVHPRRREQRRGMGTPDRHRHRASRRHQGDPGADERVRVRIRLDLGPRLEHRHQVRHQQRARRGAGPEPPRRRLPGQGVLDQGLLSGVGGQLRHARHARSPSARWTSRTSSARSRPPSAARSSRTRRSSSSPRTTRARIGRRSSPQPCPSFVLPPDGNLEWTGHYRQFLADARLDHKLTDRQNLMLRVNVDRFYDDNPQDAVGGTNAPSVARKYTRRAWTSQLNHTAVISPHLLNEARFAYLHGDPVTLWEAQELSTAYTRAGTVPFTIGQSRASDIFSHQLQLSDTADLVAGQALAPHRRKRGPPHLGRHGQRAGHRDPRHVHVQDHDHRPLRPAHAQRRAELHPAHRLRHQQLRAEAVALHRVRARQHPPAPRPDRRPRPPLRPADPDRRQEQPRAPRRLRLASGW